MVVYLHAEKPAKMITGSRTHFLRTELQFCEAITYVCVWSSQDSGMKVIGGSCTISVCAVYVCVVSVNCPLPAFSYTTKKCIALSITFDHTVCSLLCANV